MFKNVFDKYLIIPIILIFVELLFLTFSPSAMIYEIIVGGIILVVFLALLLFFNDFKELIFISFSLLPFAYLNESFHYSFAVEIVVCLPILFLGMLHIYNIILKKTFINVINSGVAIFLSLFLLVSFFSAIWGAHQGNNIKFIIVEIFHLHIYIYSFIILYSIKDNKHYAIIFRIVLITFLLISLQYLFYNTIESTGRFTAFQGHFYPIILGVVFARCLYDNMNDKIIGIIILLFLFIGVSVSLTRSLWVFNLLSLLIVWLLFQLERKYLKIKLILISLMLIILLPLLFKGDSNYLANTPKNSIKTDERLKSISSPLEDASFLMRIEMTYYSIEKFLKSPIIGTGLGDYTKFKIMLNDNMRYHYIDNSWGYILWKQGLLGFVTYTIFYLLLLRMLYQNYRNSNDKFIKSMNMGFFSGMLVGIPFGFLAPYLFKYTSNIYFAIIVAFAIYSNNKIKEETVKDYSPMYRS